jgi:hypothetical protein
MRRQWVVALVFASVISLGQQARWQHGVVLSVTKHAESPEMDPHFTSYDVSLRVGKTMYVVLYTVPRNSSMVEYRVGSDLVVHVQGTKLTFNDIQGNAHTVKILRSESIDGTSPDSRR